MWKMRRRLNWEPPHTTKRDGRERWVRSSIRTCCLKSSSMIWLSRLTSAFLFYFRATVWKFYLKMKWQSWMLCGAAGTACWRGGWSDSVCLAGDVAPPWRAWLTNDSLNCSQESSKPATNWNSDGQTWSGRETDLFDTEWEGTLRGWECSLSFRGEAFSSTEEAWPEISILTNKPFCSCLVHCVFNRCWLCFNFIYLCVYITINIYLDLDQPCPALMHWQRIWKSLCCMLM